MNRMLLFILNVTIPFLINSMEEPSTETKMQLSVIPRSQTVPLRLPSDAPDNDIIDFLEIKDHMVNIKAMISQGNVARTLTPNTQMLVNLDPKLAHTSSKDFHQINCQSSILEGASIFDTAQYTLQEFEEPSNPPVGSLANDTIDHDRYVKIEEQQLEALCIFISAYERDCPDTFPYILFALNSIMRLENKRKKIKGDTYSMLPRLLNFKDRLQYITNSENLRKIDQRKSSVPSKDLEPDMSLARDEYSRARLLLSAARSYHTKIIDNPNVESSSSEFDQIEALYCDVMSKCINAFHRQPDREEKEQLFAQIQEHLKLVHLLKAKRQEKGFAIINTEQFGDICNFVQYHKNKYEISEEEGGEITWKRALKETSKQPLPQPELNTPLKKSKIQKLLDLCCCKK